MSSYQIRSSTQYEIMIALCYIENARYSAEAAQQLSYNELVKLLPTLKRNLEVLKSVSFDGKENDHFYMDLQFCHKACVVSYEKLVKVIEMSHDDKTAYDNFCLMNSRNTLSELCDVLETIWKQYWKRFHIQEDKLHLLSTIQDKLIALFSNVAINGNEPLPANFRCLSCDRNSAYIKTGITDICDVEVKDKNDKTRSLAYCHHLIDVCKQSEHFNINRVIFERRMNEKVASQQT